LKYFNAELFKELIKKNGLTYEKLVLELKKRNVDITLSAVKSWTRKSGSFVPTADKLMALGDILGIDPNILMGGKKFYGITPVKKIPIIGASSCGKPVTDNYQGDNEFAYYNGEFYTPNLYCVIACGDSMSPDIEDGDEVICDPDRKPQNGDIVEYKIHNEKAIKIYVEYTDANIIQLIPYNQSPEFEIKTIRLDDDEINDLHISVVVAVNKLRIHDRKARLKMIKRA
jgi:repressor LexA